MTRHIVVTATGDALIERRMPQYPDEPFQRMLTLIRSADVAFTNLETVLSNYRGSPIVETGVNLSAEAGVARDLQRMGFNVTSFANNHTLNYGEEAVLTTLQVLE
ncbi:MAG: CapA family protein, partial [Armatimonadetes bacterium]|nr:CapA family protein [Armatimonadota bacterium]